jgi:hypothetical protein
MAPENVAPLVAWLASTDSREVTGRVFEVSGRAIAVAEGWGEGPRVERNERWNTADVGPAVRGLLARAREPRTPYGA